MPHNELNYNELKTKVITEIEKHPLLVLATTYEDKPTARTIMRVSNKLTLYNIAGKYTRHYKHIQTNPYVALATANLQIEGKARDKGHPLDPENREFIEALSRQHPEFYKRAEKLHFQRQSMGVIEIMPSKVTLYYRADLETGVDAYLEVLDVDAKEAYKIPRTPTGYDSPKYI